MSVAICMGIGCCIGPAGRPAGLPLSASAECLPLLPWAQERKAAEAAARKAEARRLLAEEEVELSKKKDKPQAVGKASSLFSSSSLLSHSLRFETATNCQRQPLKEHDPAGQCPTSLPPAPFPPSWPAMVQITAHQLQLMKEKEKKEKEKEGVERRLSDRREVSEEAHAAMVEVRGRRRRRVASGPVAAGLPTEPRFCGSSSSGRDSGVSQFMNE